MPRDGSLAVSPERIVADFGGRSEIARYGVGALVEAVGRDAGGKVNASLRQWAELFRKTCGQDWPRPKARLDRLARHYDVPHDPARPEVMLFALQSWYVLLVKLLVGHALAAMRGRKSPAEEAVTGDVQEVVVSLMQGGSFSALAVTDPWAGEPFDWIVQAWSESLAQAASAAAVRIAGYDPAEIVAFAAAGGDLLKPLYESLFPRAVRHALGEYYTPGWLAEHVLDQVGYFGEGRLLDPTCGSGTFLLAALGRWRKHEREKGRAGEGVKERAWEEGTASRLSTPLSPDRPSDRRFRHPPTRRRRGPGELSAGSGRSAARGGLL